MRLPPLRQELSLQPAPPSADGAPAWTLHDPASNRFFQIGWPAFEILARWPLGDAQAIADAVNRETTLRIDAEEVFALAQFLVAQHLTLAATPQDTAHLAATAARHRLSLPKWLLKNYLFLRIPLLQPMPLLRRLAPWLQGVYRPRFWWIVLGAAVLGLYLVSRQWDAFVHTFRAYAGLQGLLGLGVALSFAKVLHEFGHALTAYRHGCRVPTMGVALLVMWPVLYTDTNEAWKLKSRRERLQIGAAGVLAELALAAFATLLWNFLPDGPLRAGVFMLATSTWVVTLAINASPFTRFDGYFLLSDWLGVPNLHERAFALGRWWLREQLFGFGDAAPEMLPARQRRFLIAFAYVAWLYRFILFLSIALLVFHYFFRALGIVLMAVEIGWFLALPIARELGVWWRRRGELRWSRRTARSAGLAAALAVVLLVPWQATVRAPAVLGQAQAQGIYAPRAARVLAVDVHDGASVAAGAVLVRLTSPELDFQIERAAAEEARLRGEMERQPFDDTLRMLGPALRKRWATAREALDGYRAEAARLTLRAPFAGRVSDLDPALAPGVWLRTGEPLFTVVGADGVRGDAYVSEAAVARVRRGDRVVFVPALPESPALHCAVSGVDRVNVASLDEGYVASIYGGDLPVRRQANGALTPVQSTFRVRFDGCDRAAVPREMSGHALIAGDSASLATRGARWLGALFRREAGF